MTLASDQNPEIRVSEIELPEHKFSEKYGPMLVLALVAALGMSMIADNAVGGFLIGALIFAALVAVGMRLAERSRPADTTAESADAPHPGITMHKIPVKAGVAGAIFTIGSMLIFLIGIPALWTFLAFAIVLGIGIAVVLRTLRADC